MALKVGETDLCGSFQKLVLVKDLPLAYKYHRRRKRQVG
jgi:hypothetical protein